jgi:hypothetical protein
MTAADGLTDLPQATTRGLAGTEGSAAGETLPGPAKQVNHHPSVHATVQIAPFLPAAPMNEASNLPSLP